MFKRISATYNTADVKEMNEINSTALKDELENPDKSLKQINQ